MTLEGPTHVIADPEKLRTRLTDLEEDLALRLVSDLFGCALVIGDGLGIYYEDTRLPDYRRMVVRAYVGPHETTPDWMPSWKEIREREELIESILRAPFRIELATRNDEVLGV